jgi:hypothetical protein
MIERRSDMRYDDPRIAALAHDMRLAKPRLRVRRVRELTEDEIAGTIERAARKGAAFHARHGGGVDNSYGYAAETEVVAVAALRVGDVVLAWAGAGRIPANKVTTTGAFCGALGLPRRGPWWTYARGQTPRCGREGLPLIDTADFVVVPAEDWGVEADA